MDPNKDALNRGILAEELVSIKLLEEGFNVARPVQIGPIDMLSIWDGKVTKRLQVKSAASRTENLRYEFRILPSKGTYGDTVDFLILAGVETKSFWIIPAPQIGDLKKINCAVGGNNRFDKYFDAIRLLKKG